MKYQLNTSNYYDHAGVPVQRKTGLHFEVPDPGRTCIRKEGFYE